MRSDSASADAPGDLAPAATERRARVRQAGWRRIGAWIACIAGAVLPVSGALHGLDLRGGDAIVRAIAALRSAAPVDDVVIVALDDRTLAHVPQPLALLHPQLGAFLEAMATAGARAVAVDLVLPERSFDHVAAGYDALLLQGILAMRRAGIVVLARTIDAAGLPRPLHAPFISAAGDGGTGFALFPADDDGRVRRFDERLAADGSPVRTLAGTLAHRLGVTVTHGQLDFSRPRRWTVLPLHEVLAQIARGDTDALGRAFRGKVVLLGGTLASVDEFPVPVGVPGGPPRLNGVFIHALALEDLRAGTLVGEAPAWLCALAGALAAGLAWHLARTARRTLAVLALAGAVVPALAVGAWLAGHAIPVAGMLAVVAAPALARLALESASELRARRRMRRVFAGYVSPGVLAELESGRLDGLASRRRFVCVLFLDVRGFTARSERDSPEQVTATLNQLFEMATAAIHRHGGTVKEFMGDGVLAFFGAPNDADDPVRQAFDAARDILDSLPAVNLALRRMGQAPLDIGMGMACGEAVVGHIGAADRHSYGAVGDCVNTASRLEGLSKELGYPLVTSRDAASRLPGVVVEPLGVHSLEGHSPVEVCGWPPRSQSRERVA